MYAWTCSCGDGGPVATWEHAREASELHRCRVGRLRAEHVVALRQSAA
jgi:hypothetical protein